MISLLGESTDVHADPRAVKDIVFGRVIRHSKILVSFATEIYFA